MNGEQHFFKMRDGVELHVDIRERGHKNWLIVTHGIGEHLKRHLYLKDLFAGQYNIVFYDLRGHGLSTGEEAYVNDFHDYILDLEELLGLLKKRFRVNDYILFGHSMGALITARFLQVQCQKQFYPSKVFLNAPPVGFHGLAGQFASWAPLSLLDGLTKIPGSTKLGGLVDLNYLSHNPMIKKEYIDDKNNHLKLHTKLVLEMAKCSHQTFSRPIHPQCPAFVTVGSKDKIVSYSQLVSYFQVIEKNFSLQVIDGAFHEIHNEIDKYRLPYFDYLKSCLLN
jgi:acylglycerol lipase